MLYYEAIETRTRDLLVKLMTDQMLEKFALAGGTSLALQIGHRKSIDLDMFSKYDFDFVSLRRYLTEEYSFIERRSSENTLVGLVNGIKVDHIAHKYPELEPVINVDGIRLYSLADIAAMKLNAITGSGTRLKDFVDIAYLSRIFSLKQMLEFYHQKYNANIFNAVKSICYYDDINFKDKVEMVNGRPLRWKNIEKRLNEMYNNQDRVFTSVP